MPHVLAIDPGAQGGYAYGSDVDDPVVGRMPPLDTTAGLRSLFEVFCGLPRETEVVIEKVGGFVGEAQPGSSMFVFGANTMASRMAAVCAGLDVPDDGVAPVSWQKHLDLPRRAVPKMASKKVKAAAKADHKRDLKELAQKLYPHIRITLANADAVLLYYLRHQGLI